MSDPLRCKKCGFQLKVGRMDLCPQCGAHMLASTALGDHVPVAPRHSGKTPAIELPPPVSSSTIEQAANTRYILTPSYLRFLIPGVAAVLYGLYKLFQGDAWVVTSFYLMIGCALILVGLFFWPRD